MKIIEKIIELENKLKFYKTMTEFCSDVEILPLSPKEYYYVSENLFQNSNDVEFSTPPNINNTALIYTMSIYKDILIDEQSVRIYGVSKNTVQIKLFSLYQNNFTCHDYNGFLKKNNASESVIREANIYVLNFLKEKDNAIKVNKSRLPKEISKLLMFL